jgi:sec-independent protein translocase protein TatB
MALPRSRQAITQGFQVQTRMIDLGLSKLVLIGVVALVVIGPDKLPKVARMAGSLYGRAQRYISQVKSEISSEIELEELLRLERDAHEATLNFGKSMARELPGVEEVLRSSLDSGEVSWQVPSGAQIAMKAKDFRKKKLIQASAIPAWYKQHKAGKRGGKIGMVSRAARVGKFRAGGNRPPPFLSH